MLRHVCRGKSKVKASVLDRCVYRTDSRGGGGFLSKTLHTIEQTLDAPLAETCHNSAQLCRPLNWEVQCSPLHRNDVQACATAVGRLRCGVLRFWPLLAQQCRQVLATGGRCGCCCSRHSAADRPGRVQMDAPFGPCIFFYYHLGGAYRFSTREASIGTVLGGGGGREYGIYYTDPGAGLAQCRDSPHSLKWTNIQGQDAPKAKPLHWLRTSKRVQTRPRFLCLTLLAQSWLDRVRHRNNSLRTSEEPTQQQQKKERKRTKKKRRKRRTEGEESCGVALWCAGPCRPCQDLKRCAPRWVRHRAATAKCTGEVFTHTPSSNQHSGKAKSMAYLAHAWQTVRNRHRPLNSKAMFQSDRNYI